MENEMETGGHLPASAFRFYLQAKKQAPHKQAHHNFLYYCLNCNFTMQNVTALLVKLYRVWFTSHEKFKYTWVTLGILG